MRTGILHPGSMGAALAASIEGEVVWSSERRSAATVTRARQAGLTDASTLQSLVESVDVIISVCPPAAAMEVAEEVRRFGFEGLYADVNAISPATTRQIGQRFDRFVDGGIIGSPPPPPPPAGEPRLPGGTRLYLSGREASEVAALFGGSHVDARVIGPDPGQASALKMAYAAWTKGSSALLLAVAAMATAEGVVDDLMAEWALSVPDLPERLEQLAAGIGMKAWRFVGEMEEIAASFEISGLPEGFHLAAAELYSRLAELKDVEAGQRPEEVVNLLLDRRRED